MISLPNLAIITLSLKTHNDNDQLSMDFPQQVNVIRRVKSFALIALMREQEWVFRGCSIGSANALWRAPSVRYHSAKLATVRPAIPLASNESECARNGAIVPALNPENTNWTKPASEDNNPRIAGKRWTSSNVRLGITMLVPMVNTKSGNTCQGTIGGTNATTSRFKNRLRTCTRSQGEIVRRGDNRPASRPESTAPVMMPLINGIECQANP